MNSQADQVAAALFVPCQSGALQREELLENLASLWMASKDGGEHERRRADPRFSRLQATAGIRRLSLDLED